MKNLHLLIFGSSEEEIRENTLAALEDAFSSHRNMGDSSNALTSEYEFEFTDCQFMADLNEQGQ